MRALVTRPSDPRQQRLAQRLVADEADIFAGAVRAVLETVPGRLVLWTLIVDGTGMFTPLLQAQVPDLAYAVGRRDLGLEWRARLIDLAPAAWQQLEREALARQVAQQAQLTAFDEQERARARAEEDS